MDEKLRLVFILIILIFMLFLINYQFLDSLIIKNFNERKTIFVDRVIDGDTIVFNKTSIRLLGINSPEKGEEYSSEATKFLRNLVLNKSVELEFGKDKYDRYKRILAYLFIDNKNINLRLVEKGFANFYFPSEKDKYYSEFKEAWENCKENLCEKSKHKCSECIELEELNYKDQIVILRNSCSFNCELTNWKIKDEGRKNFIFPKFILESHKEVKIIVLNGINTQSTLFWTGKDYVWTSSGDTLFLRDNDNRLVLWENY